MAVARAEDVQVGFLSVRSDVQELRKSVRALRKNVDDLKAKTLEFPERQELYDYINRLDKSLADLSEKVVSTSVLQKFQDEIKQRVSYILRRLREQEDMSVEAARVRKFQGQLEKLEGEYQKTDTRLQASMNDLDKLHKTVESELSKLKKSFEGMQQGQAKAFETLRKSQEDALTKAAKTQEDALIKIREAQEENARAIAEDVNKSIERHERKLEEISDIIRERMETLHEQSLLDVTKRFEALSARIATEREALQAETESMRKTVAFDRSTLAQRSDVEKVQRALDKLKESAVTDKQHQKDIAMLHDDLKRLDKALETHARTYASASTVEKLRESAEEARTEIRRLASQTDDLKERVRDAVGTNAALYKELVLLNDAIASRHVMSVSRNRVERQLAQHEGAFYENGMRQILMSASIVICAIALVLGIFSWATSKFSALLWPFAGLCAGSALFFIILFYTSPAYARAKRLREARARAIASHEGHSVRSAQEYERAATTSTLSGVRKRVQSSARIAARGSKSTAPRAERRTWGFVSILNILFLIALIIFVIGQVISEFMRIPYFDASIFLVLVIALGLVAYIASDEGTDYGNARLFVTGMLSLGLAFYVYNRTAELGGLAYAIALATMTIIGILCWFFLSPEE